jgi:hypothetical protein
MRDTRRQQERETGKIKGEPTNQPSLSLSLSLFSLRTEKKKEKKWFRVLLFFC